MFGRMIGYMNHKDGFISLFVPHCNSKELIIVIYVGNGLIVGSDLSEIDVFIDQ
jgi:hypothetical protein